MIIRESKTKLTYEFCEYILFIKYNFIKVPEQMKETIILKIQSPYTRSYGSILVLLLKCKTNKAKIQTPGYWEYRGWGNESTKQAARVSKEGSKRCVEYWLKRGYSEEEARKEISKQQRATSSRCVEYWLKRGYSEEEARKEISKQQGNLFDCGKPRIAYWLSLGYSDQHAQKQANKYTREGSPRCVEYWLKRGYSEEEARKEISHRADRGSLLYFMSKYDNKTALEKYNERCSKVGRLGEKNGQYGKPSPPSSGSGISGYYGKYLFRSCMEYYAMKFFENEGISFICNDTKLFDGKVVIPYMFENKQRNYIPDFLVGSTIIEIKNKFSSKLPQNIAKRKAADDYVKNHKYFDSYEIWTDININEDVILSDYACGNIKIHPSKMEKFERLQKRIIHDIKRKESITICRKSL